MKVKLFLSILAFTAVFSNTAITQTDEARAKNSIYFELFGQGFIYSFNYERFVSQNLGLRVGFSYYLRYSWLDIGTPRVNLPLMLSYLVGNGKDERFELGVGFIPSAYLSRTRFYTKQFDVFGTATLGYRYQPTKGGLIFRAGLTPIFKFKNFFGISFGLSVGYSF